VAGEIEKKQAAEAQGSPQPSWNVLVVDDEPDVHEATKLAMKRRMWRKRAFDIKSAFTGREARDLLMEGDYRNRLQVVLVDVVMETKFAGLDLCRFIRSELPRSVRIILRTGQPGSAPEERVINDYDIDYYFAKTEATPDRLFTAIRACLRSAQDLETLLAFSTQLRSFTTALQTMANRDDLMRFMRIGLDFLELKHSARIVFVADIDSPDPASGSQLPEAALVRKAHEMKFEGNKIHSGTSLGLTSQLFVLNFVVAVADSTEPPVRCGFVIDPRSTMHGLHSDLLLFIQNWTVAMSGLLLQVRIAREKALKERMQLERLTSLTNMVTGLAHKINTPLGVAHTSNFMLKELADELDKSPVRDQISGVLSDIRETTNLLNRNLTRAGELMNSFKQLSVTQLSDECMSTELSTVVNDVIETIPHPDEIAIHVTCAEASTPWTGYPSRLAQVISSVLQNAVRHAYRDKLSGTIDVRLLAEEKTYRIEVEDYGCGIPAETLPSLFEPFAVWRGSSDAGLGLAVANNIVTGVLRGEITCKSSVGSGSKFTIRFPRVVEPADESRRSL
jgi:signal transduction histidine kinase